MPRLKNGTFIASNLTLRQILAAAFGLTKPRIIGPNWLDNDYFDFIAKSPRGVPDSQLKPMLQALLQDRFKLTYHREERDIAVYHLVVAKGGVKMPVYPSHKPPPDDPRLRYFPTMRGTETVAVLANLLTMDVGRPVIDKTGLTERYEFYLVHAPLSPQAADNLVEFAPPDIFTAVQEQLGLKLNPSKEYLDVIVIDHMERMPTEN